MKLYIYPQANPHVHDSIPAYVGVVPLSQEGIAKHCQVVTNPEEAEYFYCGQFSDSTPIDDVSPHKFEYFLKKPRKHILDIEGDWLGKKVPTILYNSILTINGAPKYFKDLGIKAFVRPTFSVLLVDLAKNRNDPFVMPMYRSFGFKGLSDPFGVRIKVAQALDKAALPCEIRFNNEWCGPNTDLKSETVVEYERIMIQNCFSLCPRGAGIDSVRFYETCAYGRVPVVVGDNLFLGHHNYDLSFVIQLSQNLEIEQLVKEFNKIYNMSDQEIIGRCVAARKYFEDVVRPYFADPTGAFLRYLKENNL